MQSTPFREQIDRCRVAQRQWADTPVRQRLRFARELRFLLVEQADRLTAAVEADIRRNPGEVVASDLLPSAAALKFLQQRGESILSPRRVGDRPLFLFGQKDRVYHRPHGVVGVIGTWNYPIFLNLVPIAQALVAGNGVLWKPSEQTPLTGERLHELFLQAGVDENLLIRLPHEREAGPDLVEADIDFLHFTGSDAVGRKIAARLGERLIPSVLELSGVDAVFVLDDADIELAARSVWYGTTLNAGQTCMACRRVFVDRAVYPAFIEKLREVTRTSPSGHLVTEGQRQHAERLLQDARDSGCDIIEAGDAELPRAVITGASPKLRLWQEASFAPLVGVMPVANDQEAIQVHAACRFGLAAAIFTANRERAETLAKRIEVGALVVNDVIVPTAHPATPFGGRRTSGWGSSQGPEGLLAMTVPQVVSFKSGRFRPHIDGGLSPNDDAVQVVRGLLRMSHSRSRLSRLAATFATIRAMARSGRKPKSP